MKILFIYNTDTTWTNNDLRILSSKHIVTKSFINNWRVLLKNINPFFLLKQDVVVFWFASLSFFPVLFLAKLLGRKVFLLSGGYDGVSVPEIAYGSFSKGPVSRFLRSWMFRAANLISCCSATYLEELIKNTGISRNKVIVNHLGFDSSLPDLTPWSQREKVIVTIGAVNSETYLRKGIKYFIDLSEMMPEWKFFIIGRIDAKMTKIIEDRRIANLKITGFMEKSAMLNLLNKAQFYLQLSHHEAFGASVIDAALMGCYPIVYNKGSLKEVVDKEGSVFEFNDLSGVRSEIFKLSNMNIDVKAKRNFYLSKYSNEKRRDLLLDSLEKCL